MQCTDFRPYQNGALIGFANIFVEKWGVHIHGCGVFQKDDKSWISFPSKEYKDENGEKKYSPIIKFEQRDHQEAFSDQCMKQINNFIENQKMTEF